MQVQAHPAQQSWVGYAITIAIIVVVMALRMRRMGQMRPLKLETLWIVPALYLAVAALMFWQLPPRGGSRLPAPPGWRSGRRSGGSAAR